MSKKRGQDCERRACDYFLKQGYKLIAKNKKICGVEVDLLLFAEHYLMVEVKSLSSEEEISFRFGKKQRQRLEWVRDYLMSTTEEIVLLKVVFVTKENKLIVLDIEDFY